MDTGSNNDQTSRSFNFRPFPSSHHFITPTQPTMSEGPKPWWWLWSPCRGEQVELDWELSAVAGGCSKTQNCRIYSNSQGYTPLGHLLVLLVFILSLVVIFGLMWYFVSIFSSLSLFDILEHFSSILTFFIIKSLNEIYGETKPLEN